MLANDILTCEVVGRAIDRSTREATFVGPGIISRSHSFILRNPRGEGEHSAIKLFRFSLGSVLLEVILDA
jgi:hypothetical protein